MTPRYTCTCDPNLARKEGCIYTYTRQTVQEAPAWSLYRKRRLQNNMPPTVCIDNCIVDTIEQLWDRGIETTGCCCGHNNERAWVQVHPDDYPAMFELGYEQRPVEMKEGYPHGLYAFYL